MKAPSRLYDELRNLWSQSAWQDRRHLQTLCWMVVGLLGAGCISLSKWGNHIQTRALMAQSRQRRFSRWLHNERIEPLKLYAPIIKQALSQWGEQPLFLILDTSMLWNRYCLIRLSVQYRGRAVPLLWKVIEHPSSAVALAVYQPLLEQAQALLPRGNAIIFLADRGFADTRLMALLRNHLRWHFRIRIKSNFNIYRPGARVIRPHGYKLKPGQAVMLHGINLGNREVVGACLHLALACDPISKQFWYVASDQPTTLQTLYEYGLRFDIEENFLDDKSNGFQLEASQLRCDKALSRLCLVLALTTLFLCCQGQQVVANGKRRWVDSHWHRGQSYLRIGWDWVTQALHRGWQLVHNLCLFGGLDPEPARASKKQVQQQFKRSFQVRRFSFGT